MKTDISSEVAKTAQRRNMPAMRPLAIFLALITTAFAQSEERKSTPKSGEGPPRREGERRGPPGMMPGGGKPQRGFDGFEKLSEAEKQKVRAAFEKAWERPEVIESRDLAMKANEEMRQKLHAALKEVDPEVVAILEKIKPPFPMDQRGLPELPQPDSPEFARMAGIRLGAEMVSMTRPERREETGRFHERIMQMPRMKEALSRLEQTPPAERLEGFKKLRDVYREITGEEFRKMREKYGESKDGKDGFRRPPEDGRPAPEKKEDAPPAKSL